MNQPIRVFVGVAALLLLVAGTALATDPSQGDSHRAPAASAHADASQASDASETPEPSDTPEPSESEQPKTADASGSPDAGAQVTDAHAQAIVDLLSAQGITATTDEIKTLAATYGVGGAMRLETWAAASGMSVGDISAMFDGGSGWGSIAKQLQQADPSLSISPGIGWVMGHGHGHTNSHAAEAHANHP